MRELYAWCVAVNHISKGIPHLYLSVNILIKCHSLLYQYVNNTFLYNAKGENNAANIFEFTVTSARLICLLRCWES